VTRKTGQGFISSARNVLKGAKTPLGCREIIERAISEGLLETRGKTPEKTLHAMLSRHILHKGSMSEFLKLPDGKFTLTKPRPNMSR
jgi:hypothetical protein